MGRKPRRRPKQLAVKLKEIRDKLGLSQNELISRMGLEGDLAREDVSAFERGTHEPNLLILLAYSEAANVFLEALVKDDMVLPERLPSKNKSLGIKRTLS